MQPVEGPGLCMADGARLRDGSLGQTEGPLEYHLSTLHLYFLPQRMGAPGVPTPRLLRKSEAYSMCSVNAGCLLLR